MSVPEVSNYPGSLDTNETLFGDPVNQITLTLKEDIGNSDTSFSVTESISTLAMPTFFAFDTGEIVYVEIMDSLSSILSSVTRGAGGTTTQQHTAGDSLRVVLVSEYISQLKNAVLAIETALGTLPQGISANVTARLTGVDTKMSQHVHDGVTTAKIPPTSISSQGANGGLDADKVDGYNAGNFTGMVPISNSTVNLTLNADMLDGYHAGNASGEVGIANGTECINLNAEMTGGVKGSSLKKQTINLILGNGVEPIPTGISGTIRIPGDMQIVGWTFLGDATGSIVIDLWNGVYDDLPLTVSRTIVATAPVAVSSNQKASNATLAGWSTTLAAQSYLAVNVNSVSDLKQGLLCLDCVRI